VLDRVELTEAQLASVEAAVMASYDPNAVARGIVGERCFVLGMFRDHRHAGMEGPPAVLWEICGALGLLDWGLIRVLDHASTHVAIAQLEPQRRQRAIAAADAKQKTGTRLPSFLNSLTPAFGRVTVLDLNHIARLQTARTAIAVQRYRLANGRLPERLEDLTPMFLDRVPTDLFDGRPLRLQRLNPGFVVYSVGPDGTDDGGRERQPRPSGQEEAPYDVTFTVER
jgi:hypothetical protein